MKIGLYNIEPKINNTALMKISQYHKDRGHEVEWYIEWNHHLYGKIYCSSLFNFTDKSQVPEGAICGGTGFDIRSKLPEEIENSNLDYSIYPNCKSSYIWFSRGCIRNCPFCIVREKEGYLKAAKPTKLNPNGNIIEIMDNNFFANPKWGAAEEHLKRWGLPVKFSSGIDVRIFEPDHAEFLLKWIKKIRGSIHIAWDNPRDDLYDKIKEITKYIKTRYLMCYILVGYWSNEREDIMRINKVMELEIDPFVMVYNKKDPYQRSIARWANRNRLRKSCEWENYKYRVEQSIPEAK